MQTPRRSFLGRMAALLAIGSAPATLAAASGPVAADGAFWPDERWLEMIASREHRMIIESGVISDALAFRRGTNFLDVLNQDFNIPDGRAGLAIGTHTAALAMILNDAMWAKHAFGAKFSVKDAQGNALTANPYKSGPPYSVDALGKRGVQFLACNRSLIRLSRELAGTGGDATAIHKELVENVLPGVIVVPAMVVALSRAQSKGVPYMAIV